MESEFQEREIYGTLTLRIAEVYIGTGFDEESHNVVLDSACCLKVHIPVVLEQKPVLEVKLYQIHKFFLVGSFEGNNVLMYPALYSTRRFIMQFFWLEVFRA